MATLSSLKTLTANAKATSGDKVTYLELKAILDATHDELLIRGIKKVANTTALATLSRTDAETVVVENLGIFKGSPTGTANGTTIFSATGGGVWILILKTVLSSSWNILTDAATIAVNLNNGPFHKIDMYATRNINFTNAVDGSSIVLKVVHKAADTTINLPGLLVADFSWATEVNDITLLSGIYDAGASQWVWDAKILYAGLASLPTIISATSVGTNQISVVFDRVVTSTTAGFSFRKNGTPLAPSAVSGSGTNTLLFTWGSFAYGDILDMTYNPSTGNCIDSSSAELAGVTNLSVTNAVGSGYDTDAQAFFTAAGITDTTQKTAVNQLVLDMKAASIWTKMKAVYPLVGGTAATHKYNLKNPLDTDAAFRLAFSGSLTHDSNGITPGGTTADYANTFFTPSVNVSSFGSMGYYCRANISGNQQLMGTYKVSGADSWQLSAYAGNLPSEIGSVVVSSISLPTPSTRLIVCTRQSGTLSKTFRDGTSIGSQTDTFDATCSNSIYLFGRNNGTGPSVSDSAGNVPCSFAFIADGLTDGNVSALNTAVNNFQTTLSRAV